MSQHIPNQSDDTTVPTLDFSRPSTAETRPSTAAARPGTSNGATHPPPSSRRRRTANGPDSEGYRPDTAQSAVGVLPDQQFFPEGGDFEEEEEGFDDDDEADKDVFAFERPVTGAVPPMGFSGSEYTSSAPGTGFRSLGSTTFSDALAPLAGPSSHGAGASTSGHAHGTPVSHLSPEMTATGQMEAVEAEGSTPELVYDPAHPPPFSGRDNLNNSSFAFMNKLNREHARERQPRPQTGSSLLSRLQRRNLNTATTQQTVDTTTDTTNMTRLDSHDTSEINSFDTSLSPDMASRLHSKSTVPLLPSTAGGMSDFSATLSTASGGTRQLMSRGSYGMTELTGDMTVPDGKTTWGDGMIGMRKEASEGGSMAGPEIDLMEEDSPYPEVRASVSNIDDPEMPCESSTSLFYAGPDPDAPVQHLLSVHGLWECSSPSSGQPAIHFSTFELPHRALLLIWCN